MAPSALIPAPSERSDLREELNRALRAETLELHGRVPPQLEPVVHVESLRFIAALCERFEARRNELLSKREVYQRRIDGGTLPGFSAETEHVRRSSWSVAPPPEDLKDRRIEITGPTDRKMVINALNSGAQVFMADFEDSHAPAWKLTLEGQRNLYDAARGRMEHVSTEGKAYVLRSPHAVLMMRPRGWHLDEEGLSFGGESVPASLFDFGLFLHANASSLRSHGSGPYLYLPKLQSAEEAALWDDVLSFSEELLGLPRGSVRCTVLIETLPALFQMHEILHALQRRVLGLNFGRWDFLFSFIKTLRAHPDFILPDRARLTMDTPFMLAASRYLVRTCHEREAQAIGGMAADIPVRDDAELNVEAISRVRADKLRELDHGYDGTWVAHPGLVPVVARVFSVAPPLPTPSSPGHDPKVSDLIVLPPGGASESGVRADLNAAVQYLESWLRGVGAAAIHYRMEDTATAEICRTQLWQWLHLEVELSEGGKLTPERLSRLTDSEMQVVRREVGEERWTHGAFAQARSLLDELIAAPELEEFLTLRAGPYVDGSPLGLDT
ncbi:MAG: malate synthase A [Euryarchaeota archaeon]|nr:malate synthase A [Euryarchaeota archaeon]